VVLHLGEPPASKVLAQWLAAAGGVQVRVHATRAVIDPSHVVSHRLVASPAEVCRRLAAELRGATGTSWTEHWQRAARQADEAIGAALAGQHLLTEPAVARELTRFDGTVVVASSMPIRDIEWFGDPAQRATVVSNRGANGIDGTVATATGVALATRRPVAVLLGDVALLHDQSSLTALSSRGVDVRIVVVDNDGGGIFSFLPQASTVDPARFERLFGTPHGTDLAALGAAHHLDVHPAVTLDELRAALLRPGPSLTRVPSDRSTNVAVHAGLHAAAVAAIR
jgi:2-succinyl-5-enolpyruvyl-6-hydroxy-3-cyclohexene-1-carboxylate synthase